MKWNLPGTMLRFADYEREVTCRAEVFSEALRELLDKHPGLRNVLVDTQGRVRTMHMVFVNGEQLPRGGDPARRLEATDVVEVVTAIAGG